jgi:membrane protein DedA with SNARE-associated domain
MFLHLLIALAGAIVGGVIWFPVGILVGRKNKATVDSVVDAGKAVSGVVEAAITEIKK